MIYIYLTYYYTSLEEMEYHNLSLFYLIYSRKDFEMVDSYKSINLFNAIEYIL